VEPAIHKVEAQGSLEPRNSRPAWVTWSPKREKRNCPDLTLNKSRERSPGPSKAKHSNNCSVKAKQGQHPARIQGSSPTFWLPVLGM
jgi:hypothetical protein